ncbi:hypothetical protein N752_04190 [Desulforamulus aquiferis]|nr:hypothetical protein [Desulforamulus aquiferis]RYD06534.1 hypothetical protein N752_04190 [Desulforamulus aquiferis]
MAGQGIYQPTWSKDGRHILFVKDKALWIINIDGGNAKELFDLDSEQDDQIGFMALCHTKMLFPGLKVNI